jgi:hypothetical protein
MIIILVALYIYLFAIKYFKVNEYFMNVKPRVGFFLQTIIKFTGVDAFYDFLAIHGIFGQQEKKKTIDSEIFILENIY